MSAADEREREERALEALIVAAFRQDDCQIEDPLEIAGKESALDEDDRRALDDLGPDLVARIVAGSRAPRREGGTASRPGVRQVERELAGSMNRGGDDELTEQARQEMERKVREIEDQEGGHQSS